MKIDENSVINEVILHHQYSKKCVSAGTDRLLI